MSADAGHSDPAAPSREALAPPGGWDVYAIAFDDDPHARWRALREATPIFDAGHGVFLVTRWSLVDTILRDARHGAGIGVAASFGADQGLAHDVMRSWLMSLDGPPQQRARDLVRREFTPRKVEALRPLVAETADRLIRTIETEIEAKAKAKADPRTGTDDAAIDLVSRLAFALPSEVIRALFDVPRDEWTQGIERIVREVGPGPADGIAMIEGVARELDARLRTGNVGSGLLGQLCRADPELGALSPLEVVANGVLLVTAAIDTTAGLIGNATACLLERPELLARLRREPACLGAVVEETLRFEPPALSCSRTAGVDLELEGISIPAGSQLLLSIAAANRDPRRHADPDRFDVDRDFSGLVSFGGGRHFCLGAALARMEAAVVLERLFLRSRIDFRLAEPARWQKRNPTVRAHERLAVVGEAARAKR